MKKQKMDFKFLIVGQGVKELKSEIDSENISNQIILIDTAKNFMTNEIEFPSSKIVNYLLISDFYISISSREFWCCNYRGYGSGITNNSK